MIYALTVDLIFGMRFYYYYYYYIVVHAGTAATIVILDGTYSFFHTRLKTGETPNVTSKYNCITYARSPKRRLI